MGTLLRRSFIHWAAGKGIKYSKGFTGVPYLSTGVTESGWANMCVRVCVCALTEPPREEDYLQNKTFIFIMYPRRPLFQQPSLLLIFQWKLFEGRKQFPKVFLRETCVRYVRWARINVIMREDDRWSIFHAMINVRIKYNLHDRKYVCVFKY